MTIAFRASLMALLVAPAVSQYCVSGAGGPVPPTGTGGGGAWSTTPPTIFHSSTVVLPGNASTIDAVNLNQLNHTWSGDLQIVLYDPNPAPAGHNLVVRLNQSNTTSFGNACDFNGDYVIVESGAPGVWPPGPATNPPTAMCGPGGTVPPDTYNQYFGDVPAGMWTQGSASIFDTPLSQVSVVPGGTYELRIYDWAAGDIGTLGDWELCGQTGGPIGTNYCTPAIPNSLGLPGVISATGSLSVANNDVTLTADQLPPMQFGYFLTSQTQGFFNPPNSNGFICLAGGIGRYNQPQNIGQGPSFSIQIDLTAVPQPANLVAVQPGETWNFQAWYRDIGNTNNFTDAVNVTFQ